VRRTRSTRLVRSALTAPTAVVAGVVLVAAAACTGDGDDEARRDRTTTTTTADQEAAVLAAYEASWRAFEEAGTDPATPDHPRLAETMTGPALAAATQALGEMAELQQHLEGQVELSPRVTELSGNRAVVEDCVIDRGQRVGADGGVVLRSEPTPWPYRAAMVMENDVWRTSELSRGEEPCEP
jgi:hypothetical protein